MALMLYRTCTQEHIRQAREHVTTLDYVRAHSVERYLHI